MLGRLLRFVAGFSSLAPPPEWPMREPLDFPRVEVVDPDLWAVGESFIAKMEPGFMLFSKGDTLGPYPTFEGAYSTAQFREA